MKLIRLTLTKQSWKNILNKGPDREGATERVCLTTLLVMDSTKGHELA